MAEKALASPRTLLVVLSASNIAAALLAVALAWLVVPGARAPTSANTLLVNGLSLTGYLAASVLVAGLWVRRRRNAASGWLQAAREPSVEEQRLIVMMPSHVTRLVAGQWLGALIIFYALNVGHST
jgi:hypothetical protein